MIRLIRPSWTVTMRGGILASAFVALVFIFVSSGAFAAGRVFYDGFEDGTTNAWAAGGGSSDYAKCDVVTSALDGGIGPKAGSRMARCNWDGTQGPFGHQNQAMVVSGWPGTEYLVRFWVRPDNDIDAKQGSKSFRFPGAYSYEAWQWESDNTLFSAVYAGDNSTQIGSTNWGCGPNIRNGQWHKLEFYVLEGSSAVMRIWIDDSLCWEATGFNSNANGGSSAYWKDFHMMSNWSLNTGWEHDANNHLYWDEFEIFSNTGTGGTGLMSDGTITASGGDTTPPVRSNGAPVGVLAYGTTSTSMTLTTDENATCKYGSSSGVAYASQPSTFSTTGGTSHSVTVSGLTNGGSYNRYVRCIDGAGNPNTTDYTISWSVSNTPPSIDLQGAASASSVISGSIYLPLPINLQGAASASSVVSGSIYLPLPAPATFERRAR